MRRGEDGGATGWGVSDTAKRGGPCIGRNPTEVEVCGISDAVLGLPRCSMRWIDLAPHAASFVR